LIFDAALTLTHNGTSLILPASTNIATAGGDVAKFVCENGASGYWRCIGYTKNITVGNAVFAASANNSTKWNNATMYTSTAAASGGVDGDIWFQY